MAQQCVARLSDWRHIIPRYCTDSAVFIHRCSLGGRTRGCLDCVTKLPLNCPSALLYFAWSWPKISIALFPRHFLAAPRFSHRAGSTESRLDGFVPRCPLSPRPLSELCVALIDLPFDYNTAMIARSIAYLLHCPCDCPLPAIIENGARSASLCNFTRPINETKRRDARPKSAPEPYGQRV